MQGLRREIFFRKWGEKHDVDENGDGGQFELWDGKYRSTHLNIKRTLSFKK